MDTPTNQITESVKEGLVSFKDGIVGFINSLFPSSYEVEFVLNAKYVVPHYLPHSLR